MTDEEIVRAYYAAYEECDVEGSLKYMSEDVVYIDHAMGFRSDTKSYLRAAWNRYFEVASNSDHSSEMHTLHVSPTGEYVIEWTERTRLNRNWAFLVAGKPYAVRGASVGLIRDGLIVHNADYYDLTTILSQSGITEIPTTIPKLDL